LEVSVVKGRNPFVPLVNVSHGARLVKGKNFYSKNIFRQSKLSTTIAVTNGRVKIGFGCWQISIIKKADLPRYYGAFSGVKF